MTVGGRGPSRDNSESFIYVSNRGLVGGKLKSRRGRSPGVLNPEGAAIADPRLGPHSRILVAPPLYNTIRFPLLPFTPCLLIYRIAPFVRFHWLTARIYRYTYATPLVYLFVCLYDVCCSARRVQWVSLPFMFNSARVLVFESAFVDCRQSISAGKWTLCCSFLAYLLGSIRTLLAIVINW